MRLNGRTDDMIPDAKWRQQLRRAMLRWFAKNARELPWRKSRDPYRVWVSEIMLQQTQVETVKPYFNRFIERFPTVAELADAEPSEVLRLWEGLGYYRRARQMHKAAQVVRDEHGGCFPTAFDDVLDLPGVGRYTAGAILSISLDQRQPILEGNTIRVYSRLLGYREDPRKASGQKLLWEFAESILPTKDVGLLNQAMMELGAKVCTPRNPSCEQCPVMSLCPTYRHGWQAEIPLTGKKIKYEDVHEAAVLVWKNRKLLLRQCGPDERWAGLWDFPRVKCDATLPKLKLANDLADLTGVDVELAAQQTLPKIKHAVTRFRITLHCLEAQYKTGRLKRTQSCKWVEPTALEDFPLSVTGRQLAKLAIRRQ